MVQFQSEIRIEIVGYRFKIQKEASKMGIYQQLLKPQRYWTRILLLTVTIAWLALFITISLSHFEAQHRLEIVEYQHRMFMEELSRISDSSRSAHLAQEAVLRLRDRKHHFTHLSSMATVDKLITELQEIKRHTKLGDFMKRLERSDFALATAGAKILSIGKTNVLSSLPKWLPIFGIDQISKYFVNGAQSVIQPSILPGECFAFTGKGEVTIKLIGDVFIDAVSIEHIHPNMSPIGIIVSAPNIFSVYGIENENDENGTHLGTFRYDIEKNQPLQEFQLIEDVTDKSFPIVKFEFEPNQSFLNYTCVYRVRVHGSFVTKY